jgi:hypothetical protein
VACRPPFVVGRACHASGTTCSRERAHPRWGSGASSPLASASDQGSACARSGRGRICSRDRRPELRPPIEDDEGIGCSHCPHRAHLFAIGAVPVPAVCPANAGSYRSSTHSLLRLIRSAAAVDPCRLTPVGSSAGAIPSRRLHQPHRQRRQSKKSDSTPCPKRRLAVLTHHDECRLASPCRRTCVWR